MVTDILTQKEGMQQKSRLTSIWCPLLLILITLTILSPVESQEPCNDREQFCGPTSSPGTPGQDDFLSRFKGQLATSCPEGEVLRGLRDDGTAICESFFALPSGECPEDSYLQGVNSENEPICLPSSDLQIPVCGTEGGGVYTVTLPVMVTDGPAQTLSAG